MALGYVSAVLSLAVFLCHVFTSEACTCIVQHPQTAYCQADYVIKAKITSRSPWNNSGWKYGVSVLHKYKYDNAYQHTNHNYLYSNNIGQCGMLLQTGTTYLIMGHVYQGKAYVSMCDVILPWSDVNHHMQHLISNNVYGRNCNCKISLCYSPPCSSAGSNTCVWPFYNSQYSCYNYWAACTSTSGHCTWSLPGNAPCSGVGHSG